MIDVPLCILSPEEVHDFLVADGYQVGTEAYMKEKSRRYYPYGDGYAEQPDWSGDRRQAVVAYGPRRAAVSTGAGAYLPGT